jgi:hypothetical protein
MPKTSYRSPPPARPRQVGREFISQWVLANTLGLTVTFLIIEIVSEMTTVYLGGLLLGGLLLGIAQWLVLRKYIWGRFIAIFWVIATLFGWIAGICILGGIALFGLIIFPFMYLVPVATSPPYDGIPIQGWLGVVSFMLGVGGFIGGLITGFLQYLVLRKRVSSASGWITVAAIGQMLGCMILSLQLQNDRIPLIAASFGVQEATARIAIGAAIGAMIGVVYGLITGCRMIRLLRRPIDNALDRSPEV